MNIGQRVCSSLMCPCKLYAALSVDVLCTKIHSDGFNGSEHPMSDCLAFWNKFFGCHSFAIKKQDKYCFDFWKRGFFVVILDQSQDMLCHFYQWVVGKTPILIVGNYWVDKIKIIFYHLQEICTWDTRCCRCSVVKVCGTKCEHEFLPFKSSRKMMYWTIVCGILYSPLSPYGWLDNLFSKPVPPVWCFRTFWVLPAFLFSPHL